MNHRDDYLIGMVAGTLILYSTALLVGVGLLIAHFWKG